MCEADRKDSAPKIQSPNNEHNDKSPTSESHHHSRQRRSTVKSSKKELFKVKTKARQRRWTTFGDDLVATRCGIEFSVS